MTRGALYRVRHPSGDPKRARVFVVAGRRQVIESSYSSVICAPVYSSRGGSASEVDVGPEQGLKHASAIHCDALMSIPKSALTDYVGSLAPSLLARFDTALRVALELD